MRLRFRAAEPHVLRRGSRRLGAFGYAKYTGKLGVCLATAGPGAVHLFNEIIDARAGTPHQLGLLRNPEYGTVTVDHEPQKAQQAPDDYCKVQDKGADGETRPG